MTMARYSGVVTDEAGNIVPSATIEVRREIPGQPLAALKSDRAGISAISNPFTAEADGTFAFHVVGGAYQIRAYTVSPAFEAPPRRYVPIGLAAESDGVDGIDAGILFSWDTGTTDADPLAGNIRANNASMASATFLYISKTSRGASDVENFLLALDDSTSTVKGTIVLSRPTDESQSTFNVTAVTDATDYVKVAVSNHSGATAFAAVDEISIQFYRAGDKGNTGAAGSNGSNGTNGTNGIDGASALTVVRVAAITNVTIASALENGDSLDGVTLATNDLVLLTGQSAPEENGVYVVAASGAASRASAFAAYNDHPGRYFSVTEGTAGADKLYRCTSNKGGTLGVTAIAISEFTSGSGGISIRDFGAVGDGVIVAATVSIASGAATLTATGATFVAADAGKRIVVPGAGSAGAALATTILSFTDTTHVTLGANAATTLSSSAKTILYGTDNTSAFTSAVAALPAAGGIVKIPRGRFVITATHSILRGGISFEGEGAVYADGNVSQARDHSASQIAWGSASASPMFSFQPTIDNDTDVVLRGGGFRDCLIDAFGNATVGVRVLSCQGLRFDSAHVVECAASGVGWFFGTFTAGSTPGKYTSSYHHSTNCTYSATNTSLGLALWGANALYNTCFSQFFGCTYKSLATYPVRLEDCDSNTFMGCSSNGWLLCGQGTASFSVGSYYPCRHNTFWGCIGNVLAQVNTSGTLPSLANIWYGGNLDNSIPFPTIEAGADLTVLLTATSFTGAKGGVQYGQAAAGTTVRRATTQSIPDNTSTKITFTDPTNDPLDCFDSANNTRLTVPNGIKFARCTAQATYLNNATGLRYADILRNGSTVFSRKHTNGDATYAQALTLDSGWLAVSAGQYFELRVLQTSGGALDVLSIETWLQLELK